LIRGGPSVKVFGGTKKGGEVDTQKIKWDRSWVVGVREGVDKHGHERRGERGTFSGMQRNFLRVCVFCTTSEPAFLKCIRDRVEWMDDGSGIELLWFVNEQGGLLSLGYGGHKEGYMCGARCPMLDMRKEQNIRREQNENALGICLFRIWKRGGRGNRDKRRGLRRGEHLDTLFLRRPGRFLVITKIDEARLDAIFLLRREGHTWDA
jgi:hypothetical protein